MLKGATALVTGASSGIGKACCEVFTREGCKVIGTGRNRESLQRLVDSKQAAGFVVGDLTHEGECERVVKEVIKMLREERLTILVNCAGVLQGGAIGNVGLENFKFNFTANVQSVFEMMTHAIPFLKKESIALSPNIINVSSVNGLQSFANCANYCASKAAVDQLTRCASVDLAPFGIRANCINPGVVKTALHNTAGVVGEDYDKFLDRSINVTHPLGKPLNRVATPLEVAELICFVASTKAAFITGDTIAIDGGRQNLGAR